MSIVCSVVGHKRSSQAVWNRDFHFSTCPRCKADVVEAEDGQWVTSPRGYRIVRKQPAPEALVPEVAAASEPRTVWDDVREPEPASPLQEKRARPDRRADPMGNLPASLGGIERRREGDRRKPGTDYRPNRRKGLLAQ